MLFCRNSLTCQLLGTPPYILLFYSLYQQHSPQKLHTITEYVNHFKITFITKMYNLLSLPLLVFILLPIYGREGIVLGTKFLNSDFAGFTVLKSSECENPIVGG